VSDVPPLLLLLSSACLGGRAAKALSSALQSKKRGEGMTVPDKWLPHVERVREMLQQRLGASCEVREVQQAGDHVLVEYECTGEVKVSDIRSFVEQGKKEQIVDEPDMKLLPMSADRFVLRTRVYEPKKK
jgi:hypothetical protein